MAVRMAALREAAGIVGPAQRFGGTGCGAVGQGVLHVVGHGLVEEVARDVAVLHAQAVAAAGVHGRAADRLEGALAVEPSDPLHDGVGDHGNTRITHHAVRFIAPEVPYRQAPLLVGDGQHRVDDVGHPLRVEDRHQRHRRAVGVPQREGRMGRVAGIFVHPAVGSAVRAVGVAELRRGDHRVVERRVEDPPGRLVRGRDAHLRELLVPRRIGCRGHGFEVPAGEFCREVRLRTLDAHGREGHLHQQLFALRRVEIHTGITGVDQGHLGIDQLTRLQVANRFGRFRELGREVDLLVFGPARRVAPAPDACAVLREAESRLGGLVPAAAVFEVEDHGSLLRGGEGVAVESDARRGGHLGLDAVAGQGHRVVARTHDLLRAVGIGPHARRGVLLHSAGTGHLAYDGHDRDVEQVADARSGEMRVREADHCGIGDVVARAPVPLLGNARRAHLHESERDVRPDEDVTVSAGSDPGVDPAGRALRGLRLRAGGKERQQRGCAQKSLQVHLRLLF